MENEDIKKSLHELKEQYGAEREKLNSVDKLVREPLDKEIVTDLWKLSNAEIEREMWNRLPILDTHADCLPGGPMASHRFLLGKPIVLMKKLLRFIARPYSVMLLQKQNRLNRELINFHLLTFLKLHNLEQKIQKMKERVDGQEAIMPAEPLIGKEKAREQ